MADDDHDVPAPGRRLANGVGVRAGGEPVVGLGLHPDGVADLLCGLSRAHEWARENRVRADPVGREPLAEVARLLTSLPGQRADLVGLTAGGLGVTDDEEPHPEA